MSVAIGETRAGTVARAIGVAAYLGGLGYLLILLWRWALIAVLGIADPATGIAQLVGQAAILLGAVSVAAFYARVRSGALAGVGVDVPTVVDVGWGLATLGALYGLNLVVEAVGVPLAEHSIRPIARANPEILLVLIVGSLVFVGPGEELLYRGLVQRIAARSVNDAPAIVIASVVFAVVHVFALVASSPAAIAGTLAVIFVLSLALGALYAHTGSLTVVALTHGLYDAVAFGLMYWEFGLP